MQIGPQDYMNDTMCAPCYSYSVVSDNVGVALYVLTRDPAQFYELYNATVYDKLIQQGEQTKIGGVMMMMMMMMVVTSDRGSEFDN